MRRGGLIVGAFTVLLWTTIGADPAAAQDPRAVLGDEGVRLAAAKEACRQDASNRGLQLREILGARLDRGQVYLVSMRLRRDGRDYDVGCEFDWKRREGRIRASDLSAIYGGGSGGGDRNSQRAQQICARDARDRGYEVYETQGTRREGDTILVQLYGGRRGERFYIGCRYDRRNERTELFRTQNQNDGGRARAESLCRREVERRGWRLEEYLGSRPDGRDYLVLMRTRDGSRKQDTGCRYEARRDRAQLVDGGASSGADASLERARRTCVNAFEQRGWRVQDILREGRVDSHVWRVDARVRDGSARRDWRCYVDQRNWRTQLRPG
jgi:hypothetical protein